MYQIVACLPTVSFLKAPKAIVTLGKENLEKVGLEPHSSLEPLYGQLGY